MCSSGRELGQDRAAARAVLLEPGELLLSLLRLTETVGFGRRLVLGLGLGPGKELGRRVVCEDDLLEVLRGLRGVRLLEAGTALEDLVLLRRPDLGPDLLDLARSAVEELPRAVGIEDVVDVLLDLAHERRAELDRLLVGVVVGLAVLEERAGVPDHLLHASDEVPRLVVLAVGTLVERPHRGPDDLERYEELGEPIVVEREARGLGLRLLGGLGHTTAS